MATMISYPSVVPLAQSLSTEDHELLAKSKTVLAKKSNGILLADAMHQPIGQIAANVLALRLLSLAIELATKSAIDRSFLPLIVALCNSPYVKLSLYVLKVVGESIPMQDHPIMTEWFACFTTRWSQSDEPLSDASFWTICQYLRGQVLASVDMCFPFNLKGLPIVSQCQSAKGQKHKKFDAPHVRSPADATWHGLGTADLVSYIHVISDLINPIMWTDANFSDAYIASNAIRRVEEQITASYLPCPKLTINRAGAPVRAPQTKPAVAMPATMAATVAVVAPASHEKILMPTKDLSSLHKKGEFPSIAKGLKKTTPSKQ